MVCAKCGHEITGEVAFCPYCGEKLAQTEPVVEGPIYQVDIKGLLKSGRLMVYRDRVEFVSSSVQKSVFYYASLVSVKKGWDCIDFITEDGRTESCPAGRKTVHEAFLYIEQAVQPYLAQRQSRLMSQGVRYSFPSSQGFLNEGVLNLSADHAEFRAKTGKIDVVSYRDVKYVAAPAATLDFTLFGGGVRSFAVSRELRDEVLAYVAEAVAPYLAQRKVELLAQGIYFSFLSADGAVANVLADRVELRNQSGYAEAVFFQNVRAVSVYMGMLELALTDGTSRSFSLDGDPGDEVLVFVNQAIEPYVKARTVGFNAAFGVDERIEINEERGVFHIIRQGGREITGERPLAALAHCTWVENRELNALGSMMSGGIAIFKSAAKAAGSQSAGEAEDWISSAGVMLTIRTEQGNVTEKVWFGIFPTGMGRTNKKYERYLAEWAGLSGYLRSRCPECELFASMPPDQVGRSLGIQAPAAVAAPAVGAAPVIPQPQPANTIAAAPEPPQAPATAHQDDLGITKYIEGVSRFIGGCPTPMAIALQGNRGSEENSVLRMLFNRLRDQYGNRLLWLNARQFAQGDPGEALSILAGKKLVGLFTGESSGDAKSRAANIAVGMIKLVAGAIAPESSAGDNLVDGIFDHNANESAEQLVKLFSKQVEERSGGSEKVVLFVDGLGQLAPTRAVELLDAMRDFLECKGCVFVIAADYDDILSGAQKLYDESRAKRFFDGLFKMSFRVPASSYNVQNYIKGKVEGMNLRIGDDGELELYTELVQHSVGKDPESIDRLFRSFQLLQVMVDEEVYESRYKRLALFALLCMQTSFRDAYDYALGMRDNVTTEFLASLCGESAQLWDAAQGSGEEKAAYRDFGGVLAQIINQDGDAEISEAECRAFAEVLELSSVTSR